MSVVNLFGAVWMVVLTLAIVGSALLVVGAIENLRKAVLQTRETLLVAASAVNTTTNRSAMATAAHVEATRALVEVSRQVASALATSGAGSVKH